MPDDSPSICRVCLKECNGKQSDSVNNEKCSDLLKNYTGTEITPSGDYPCSVCESCSKELMMLVKFVRRFRSTTRKIKKIMCQTISTTVKEENSSSHVVVKEEIKELNEHWTLIKAGDLGLKKDMIQCLTCGLMLQSKSAFIVHYRRHSGEKPCICRHCGRGFTQSGTLNEHVKRQHAGGKTRYRYTCEACGKQFWRRGALTVHARIHTKEKPYQCSYCPRAFAQFSEHLLHTRTHTGQRPHACSTCPKAFISHSALRRHRTVHEDERRFGCHICETRLKSKESLKKHILVMHTAEKKNICDVCGAKFSLKYNLKLHMKVRHSAKSGVCSVCDKSFSNLNKHMSTHAAEILLSCSFCNKKFLRDKALQLHVCKCHSDKKMSSFPCTFQECTAIFSKQSKLSFHVLKIHTQHTPHVCSVCSKGFYRLADLRKHIKSSHETQQTAVPVDNNSIANCENVATTSEINGL